MSATFNQLVNNLVMQAFAQGNLEVEPTKVGFKLTTKPKGLGIKTTVAEYVVHRDSANA